ncbi:MAG: hypothetical protein JO020_05865 [Chloroflexi bacterium]|nr:hypothetical protein [Chloroflexota bacterium]
MQARGFAAIDLDTDQWCEWVPIAGGNGVDGDRDWVWREGRVGNLLAYHLERCLRLKQTVEPQLRKAATVEVDTSAPLDEVVSVILRLIAPAVE